MKTDMPAAPIIDLALAGPSEEEWDAVCSRLPIESLPACERLVVVSPHPDDETLGVGGIIATAAAGGVPVMLVCVTDGEAASPEPGLGLRRRGELAEALAALAPSGGYGVERLAVADGHVDRHVDEVHARLAALLHPTDLVLTTIGDDGHPDHAATARAAARAAADHDVQLWSFPVWAWHCHDPKSSSIQLGIRVMLDQPARTRKRSAMASYQSQLGGPRPVVPPRMLQRLDRSFEVLVPMEAAS